MPILEARVHRLARRSPVGLAWFLTPWSVTHSEVCIQDFNSLTALCLLWCPRLPLAAWRTPSSMTNPTRALQIPQTTHYLATRHRTPIKSEPYDGNHRPTD